MATMTAPAIGGADSDIVVTETTKNQGTGASLPSKTGFYLSANTTLDAADPWIGDRTVSSLGPGIAAQASTTLHIPLSTATGLYRILAKADWDDTIPESSETNNTRTIVIQIGPDLAVSALTAPATAAAGGAISVSDTTKNQGGGTAGASTTRFYWSTNLSLDASDQVIGSTNSRAARRRSIGRLHGNDNRPGVGGGWLVLRDSSGRWRQAKYRKQRKRTTRGQAGRSRWDPTLS